MNAAHHHQVRLALAQYRDRLVQGHQGRGAGRVQGDGRPLQAQGVGHPTGHGVEGRAADGVETRGRLADLVGGGQAYAAVIVVADADVDAAAGVAEAFRVNAGVFQSLPAGFQGHPLLRVEQLGFHRRNAKELCVKQVNVVHQGGVAAGRILGG